MSSDGDRHDLQRRLDALRAEVEPGAHRRHVRQRHGPLEADGLPALVELADHAGNQAHVGSESISALIVSSIVRYIVAASAQSYSPWARNGPRDGAIVFEAHFKGR